MTGRRMAWRSAFVDAVRWPQAGAETGIWQPSRFRDSGSARFLSRPHDAASRLLATATPVPKRHLRSYGNNSLPTGEQALDEPQRAFPSWFLRIVCDRCGKERMVNEGPHGAGRDADPGYHRSYAPRWMRRRASIRRTADRHTRRLQTSVQHRARRARRALISPGT
jgi:hypothetical protein